MENLRRGDWTGDGNIEVLLRDDGGEGLLKFGLADGECKEISILNK
jgi:hypothetical protein